MPLMDKKRLCYLDFEYNTTQEEHLNLVSCSYLVGETTTTVWLYEDQGAKDALRETFLDLMAQGCIFVAFNVVAEGSAFWSLGIDPTKATWVDLQAEWKMLINHWHEYQYGKQLIKGKIVNTHPPAPFGEKDPKLNYSKPEKSFSAMCFKLLQLKVDTSHKDMVRNIIIANHNLQKHKDTILKYNESDVWPLKDLLKKVISIYAKRPELKVSWTEVYRRGRVVADAALLTCRGYPVDTEQVRRFAANVPKILNDLCEDINSQFPELNIFYWDKKRSLYSKKEKPLRDWIMAQGLEKVWDKTEKGQLSLSLEAFTRHFDFRHDFPRGNVGAQIVRFLKTKQSLNGFMPKTRGETFFDSLGSDSRVRCYLNPYGSQSGRYQPKATSYIPLKSAWMRSMIVPKDPYSICGIDYVSEEFLISACWAGDEKMYEAYKSGDPYLHFGKLAGAIPKDGTKESHKKERNLFKSTTLAISYLMTAKGLAAKLTNDMGEEYTEDQAQALIDKFNDVFYVYAEKLEREQFEYIIRGYQKQKDGWIMFGDNPNRRSVANCPIQGLGAVALRQAITDCIDQDIRVILPLHDALYIEYIKLREIDRLAQIMTDAFTNCFSGRAKEMARAIRLEADLWGPALEDGELRTPGGLRAKTQNVYIDSRSRKEYERFKQYI